MSKRKTKSDPRVSRIKELAPLVEEYNGLRYDIANEARIADARSVVGKYFKYRNSYGGSVEREKWWLYVHVVSVSDDGMAVCVTFQDDRRGALSAELNRHLYGGTIVNSYVPITRAEYARANAAFLARLKGLV